MARAHRGLKPLSQAELAQQRLDARMQCFARTVPGEDSSLEQVHAQPALDAGDRRCSARRPAPGDDYVGIESSRCHVPRRFRMTTRPSVNAWTSSNTSTRMILKSAGSGAWVPQR
jgi:hypothetical protein